jgi:excisionase family DNA binding protein
MTSATSLPPDLLSPSEAARTAGVSESAVRAWLRDGKLPCIATPLGRLIDRAALGEMIARRESTSRTQCNRRSTGEEGEGDDDSEG